MKRLFSVSTVVSTIESTRSSDRVLLRVVLAAVVLASIWFIWSLNSSVSVTDIRSGGHITEGIVGTPRFVNPALALTRADQDVTALIYSGLLQIDEVGELVPDIAADWTLSEDGTRYSITLRQDVTFHDDTPLTAADVLYTINLVQNSDLKSPLRGNWNGVVATQVDDYTIEIVLEEPYAPFVANLTLGILPKHIWQDIPTEQVPFSTYNTTPIGSGPYQISDTTFDDNGTVSEYQLESFPAHVPVPYLSMINLQFYGDTVALQQAWNKGDIDSSAYLTPGSVAQLVNNDSYQVTETPLTRTFGLFFNQNKSPVLRDAAVREALELAIDRSTLVEQNLSGAGIPSSQAINQTAATVELSDVHADAGTSTEPNPLDLAAFVLEEAGWNQVDDGGVWEKDIDDDTITLAVTIRTTNLPVFDSTLAAVTDAWEALGVAVATEQFTQSDLVQSVIRERDFEVLLFGIDPGQTQDGYPFWHSSQQDDPGLNVSQYTNLTVDEALETIRTTNDSTEREAAVATVNTIIQEERPAIFLFRPTVQYVTPATLQLAVPARFSKTADRFSTVPYWYAEQRTLWPIFTQSETTKTEDLNTEVDK